MNSIANTIFLHCAYSAIERCSPVFNYNRKTGWMPPSFRCFVVPAGTAARGDTRTAPNAPPVSTDCPSQPQTPNGFGGRPWPLWTLRPDQPCNRGEDLRCAGGDGGAVGGVDGTTHEQRQTPIPFQRKSRPSRKHQIDSAGDINCMGLTKLMSMAPIRQ